MFWRFIPYGIQTCMEHVASKKRYTLHAMFRIISPEEKYMKLYTKQSKLIIICFIKTNIWIQPPPWPSGEGRETH